MESVNTQVSQKKANLGHPRLSMIRHADFAFVKQPGRSTIRCFSSDKKEIRDQGGVRKFLDQCLSKKWIFGICIPVCALESKAVMSKANAADAGTITIGKDLTVNRLGFGAMRLTGEGIWGDPKDPAECKRVLKSLPDLGVNFIDTADAYGPEVSENLISRGSASLSEGVGDRHEGRVNSPGAGSMGSGGARGVPATMRRNELTPAEG